MNKLEMLVQTVDAHYDSFTETFCYHFSCSLLNIYKGRCDLFVTNENTIIREEIIIKHDRARMEGNLKVKNNFFKSLPIQLSNKSDKPAKIEITIDNNLNVSPEGILFIDKEVRAKILNYKFFVSIF